MQSLLYIGRKRRAWSALTSHYLQMCMTAAGIITTLKLSHGNGKATARRSCNHLIDRSTQSVKIRICTIILRCPCSILAAVFLPLKIVRSSQQKWTSQESGLQRYGWRTVHNFARNSCSILTKSNIKQPYDSRNTIVNKWCKMDLGERPGSKIMKDLDLSLKFTYL